MRYRERGETARESERGGKRERGIQSIGVKESKGGKKNVREGGRGRDRWI